MTGSEWPESCSILKGGGNRSQAPARPVSGIVDLGTDRPLGYVQNDELLAQRVSVTAT
jgi:hypothetical protein